MRLLSWNVQGLGNPWTVHHLRELVKDNNPSIVFLMETRLHDRESQVIRQSFLDFNFLVVNSVRRAGGLMLFWNKSLDVKITIFSNNHIDFNVNDHNGGEWRGSGVYGSPKSQDKHRTWTLLRALKVVSNLLWVCFEDFNEVLYSFEKLGTRPCNLREMEEFERCCQICNVQDLGSSGVTMTWSNGRRGSSNVQKRLDRFLATSDWSILFPSNLVRILPRVASDHSPIMLWLDGNVNEGSSKRRFRFEHMWLRDENLGKVIEDAWLSGVREGRESNPITLVRGCAQRLAQWNKTCFGHVQRKIHGKIKRLNLLQSQSRDGSYNEQYVLQKEIKELYTREEIIWRQRSRVQWLKEGDRNTRLSMLERVVDERETNYSD